MDIYNYNSRSYGTNQEFQIVYFTYISRTFKTLFFQFLFTIGSLLLVRFNNQVSSFVINNVIPLFGIGSIGSIATIFYMTMITSRKTEIQLAIFTLCETIILCAISINYGKDVVMMALTVTIGMSSAIGTYALLTNINHSYLARSLYSVLTCLLTISIFNIFAGLHILYIIELYIGTLLFLGYIVYDIQHYLHDKSNISGYIQEDLHIDAAINIYIDIINIFVRLLEIIARINGDRKQEKYI